MLAAVMLQVPSTYAQAREPVPAVNSAAAVAVATGGRGCRFCDRARRHRRGAARAIRLARPGAGVGTTIRLCAGPRVAFAPLIAGRLPLGQAAQALAASGRPEHLKIVLDVP
jgi:hypothetical protein